MIDERKILTKSQKTTSGFCKELMLLLCLVLSIASIFLFKTKLYFSIPLTILCLICIVYSFVRNTLNRICFILFSIFSPLGILVTHFWLLYLLIDNTIFSFRLRKTFIYFFIVLLIADYIYYRLIPHEKPCDISTENITSAYDNYINSDCERDVYFVDAAKFAIEKKKLSVGMLQRVFKIGFNRAARIMDQLCDAGVVGPEVGTKPRKVLMSIKELEQALENDDFKSSSISDNQALVDSSITNQSFDNMTGYEFESFCSELLQENGFSAEITQASGDFGADIIARKSGITYAIQCKCYSSDVGIDAVYQISGGTKYYHANVGIVLTNRYFTSQAKNLASEIGIILWDRDFLNSLISNCK